MTRRPPRRRRGAAEARREILEAAERRLRDEGPEGLRVQAVARDVGVSDAAVHHHFGSRRGLAEALLRHAGRRLRDEVLAVADGEADAPGLAALADRIAYIYGDLGYARLSLWLRLLDRPARGAGLFRELAEALHAARVAQARRTRQQPPALDDSLLLVAALNVVLWAESLVAGPMLRSVGLPGDRASTRRLRARIVAILAEAFGLAVRRPATRRRGAGG